MKSTLEKLTHAAMEYLRLNPPRNEPGHVVAGTRLRELCLDVIERRFEVSAKGAERRVPAFHRDGRVLLVDDLGPDLVLVHKDEDCKVRRFQRHQIKVYTRWNDPEDEGVETVYYVQSSAE